MKVAGQKLGRITILGLVLVLVSFLIFLLKGLEVFDTFGVKAIIVLLAAIVLLYLLIDSQRSRRHLLYAGLATIAAGHRAIYVGQVSYFVPLEIILWTLFVVVIIEKVNASERQNLGVPVLLGFFVVWSVAVAIGSSFGSQNWDNILGWTSPLVVGLPAFVVVRHLISTTDHLKTVLMIIMGVSLTMSVLAIIEYEFPVVESVLPWLFTSQAFFTQEGFRRAAFSFFGYPAAATFVAWGMLICYDYFFHTSNRLQQILAFITFILGGWAIYISGQRSSWLGFGVALVVLNIPRGFRGVGGVAILWGVVTQLSNQFWSRVDTVTVYLERGVVRDTSTEQRINRVAWAWDMILDKPILGGGYGHWLAHNVFLEIGSTIGIIPALAFAAFVIQLVWRIFRTALGSSADERRYGWLFLSLSALWVVQMSLETVFQTAAFAAAHWAMMAVAWNLRDLCAAKQAVEGHLLNLPLTQGVQFHDYSASPHVQ